MVRGRVILVVRPDSWRAGTVGPEVLPVMKIVGGEFLRSAVNSDGFFFKAILNDTGASFFPHTTEHRDATQPGLCYKDDSMGNALAATIKPRRIDIRHHRGFSDERVRGIAQRLLECPETEAIAGFGVNYQGRSLIAETET